MLQIGARITDLTQRRRGVEIGRVGAVMAPLDWPTGAVALWLILGQSNAQGRAPRSQDPAKTNVAAAVDFFAGLPSPAADYAGPHPWWGVSRPGITANPTVNGQLEQLSVAGGAPTTTTHVFTAGTFGIPIGTEGFGPEIGLVRAVLEGGVPAYWRDDVDPRLFLLKPSNGSTSVDQFRDGGDMNAYLMEHLTQSAGDNLASIAAAKTVLLQGAIFVIGEQDSNNEHDGSVEPGSFERRMAEWIRQVRGLFGYVDLPIVMAEIYDNAGVVAKSAAINTQLAAVASAVGNATVLDSATWAVADTVHYDAAAMDALGAQAFAWLRARPEARTDGLIVSRPYAGTLQPVLTLPPVWKDHAATTSTFYARANVSGTLHLATLASPPASAAAVEAAAHFSAAMVAGVDEEINGTGFTGGVSTVWAVIKTAGGAFSAPVAIHRNSNPGKFVVDTPDLLVGGEDGISGDIRIGTGGTIYWAIHPQTAKTMSTRDVIERAFSPVAAGSEPIAVANVTQPFAVSGLAPGDYSLFITSLTAEDAEGETWRVDFTATGPIYPFGSGGSVSPSVVFPDGSIWRRHRFSASANFVVTAGAVHTNMVVRLVLAGAGAAGGSGGISGGGGAGDVIVRSSADELILAPGTYSVVIGNGGVAVADLRGGDGSPSTFAGLTAPGGGGGGSPLDAGGVPNPGGSGGGAAPTTGTGGASVGPGSGNVGGVATTSSPHGAGGGGGALGAGGDGSNTFFAGFGTGGPGGSGLTVSDPPTAERFGSGGAGAGEALQGSVEFGAGAAGGGTSSGGASNGFSAASGFGHGGGGASGAGFVGGDGGSGKLDLFYKVQDAP